jgi:hypothetical protein
MAPRDGLAQMKKLALASALLLAASPAAGRVLRQQTGEALDRLAADVVSNHFCRLGSAQAISENDSLKMLWRS